MNKRTKGWKPQIGEQYWFVLYPEMHNVGHTWKVGQSWHTNPDNYADSIRFEHYNCYKTEADVLHLIDKLKEVMVKHSI